jgi:RimJ/RimL family protein N-acetyltransferase
MMGHYKKVAGEKCYLSPPAVEDPERWAEWDNDLETTLLLGGEVHQIITAEREKEWTAEGVRRGDPVFSILEQGSDRLIGRGMLFDIDQLNRSAKLGILIGEKDCWSRGYGEEAVRLLLDFGFNLLNLNSIMLGVFAFNRRAIRCYQKVGFKEIGRRRQARLVNGCKYDSVLMDILAEEFAPNPRLSAIIGPD